jgi:hypothetical protein
MRRRSRRRGASLLEVGLTLPVFLVLVLGTLDLGLAVFRQHTITAAARSGTRMAMVHGSLAPTSFGQWGPETIDKKLSQAKPDHKDTIVEALQPLLVASDPKETRVLAEWPDGGNAPGQHARVTVTSAYHPLMTFIFGDTDVTLKSTSTMTIAH